MLLHLLGDQKGTESRYNKKAEGGRFGLSLKGWGFDMLSISCLKHYPNKIDKSIKT